MKQYRPLAGTTKKVSTVQSFLPDLDVSSIWLSESLLQQKDVVSQQKQFFSPGPPPGSTGVGVEPKQDSCTRKLQWWGIIKTGNKIDRSWYVCACRVCVSCARVVCACRVCVSCECELCCVYCVACVCVCACHVRVSCVRVVRVCRVSVSYVAYIVLRVCVCVRVCVVRSWYGLGRGTV